jgi:hypothetical protein
MSIVYIDFFSCLSFQAIRRAIRKLTGTLHIVSTNRSATGRAIWLMDGSRAGTFAEGAQQCPVPHRASDGPLQ